LGEKIMKDTDVFIVAARRTPVGAFLGSLEKVSAPELGSTAIRAALADAKLPSELAPSAVYMGNVLSAGLGQAPARQAALHAGISPAVPTTTVSKVCGSGLEAVVLGARAIRTEDAEIVVAGGMESMSRAPYLMPAARQGARIGNAEIIDGMMFDGLTDPYKKQPMGLFGELCAKEYQLSRAAQDEFAARSYRLALESQNAGLFDAEIAEVAVPERKGPPTVVRKDEEPGRGKPEKFAELRPAFDKDGTITAANASSINDGAAALVLMSGRQVKALGVRPLVRFVRSVSAAQAPEWFTTAPALAMDRLLAAEKLHPSDVDLFEINEAFSCVTMACTRLSKLDPERVNVRGGAVAIGHPIGASGARILTTLVHTMVQQKKQRGVAAICIGGGEAIASLVELC
jgi:acetyl-CoA C-acetyltransferase